MKTLLLIICILLLLYLFLLHPRMRRPDADIFRGCFFAHRGLHDGNVSVPENSLAAFSRAVENGYGIEMDVQLSADGIPVVFHDATLSRMCSIDRRVDSMTFDELRRLSLADSSEHIPSFEEALQLIAGRVPLLVEIKMDRIDFNIPQKIDSLLSSYTVSYTHLSISLLIPAFSLLNSPQHLTVLLLPVKIAPLPITYVIPKLRCCVLAPDIFGAGPLD